MNWYLELPLSLPCPPDVVKYVQRLSSCSLALVNLGFEAVVFLAGTGRHTNAPVAEKSLSPVLSSPLERLCYPPPPAVIAEVVVWHYLAETDLPRMYVSCYLTRITTARAVHPLLLFCGFCVLGGFLPRRKNGRLQGAHEKGRLQPDEVSHEVGIVTKTCFDSLSLSFAFFFISNLLRPTFSEGRLKAARYRHTTRPRFCCVLFLYFY